MKAWIVEDETAAATNLQRLIHEVDPTLEVVGVIDTVVETIAWVRTRELPDLIFMDIHLSDGQAFKIFEQVEVPVPIIFTTAYDQYALEAFRVNSIDYILKPIKKEELSRALDKFKRFTYAEINHYVERVGSLVKMPQTFLIPLRDKLIPLLVADIAFCHTANEKVTATTHDKHTFPLDKTLDTLMGLLSAEQFFRANRQFIVSRAAIRDISVWFGSRLSVNLKVETPERIIISKSRVPEFKRWFLGV